MPKVAVQRVEATQYLGAPPFHPSESFPELARVGIVESDVKNVTHSAVRDMFGLLGLDAEHAGTPEWNPLGKYIRTGDKVVIKPNLVLHPYGAQKDGNCLTTHGSVLRAVLDYAYIATGRSGQIVIADAPLQSADFASVVKEAGLLEIQTYYRDVLRKEIEILDLRQIHAFLDEESSFKRRVERLRGDPRGYLEVDLGGASLLKDLDDAGPRYVVGDYDVDVTNKRHCDLRHEYVISRTVLDADVVVCVPKLKTHSKAGLTVSLKNLVGIIGSKDCLPHHRHGKTDQRGDEFPADYPTSWLLSARAYSLLQGRIPQSVWRLLRSLAQIALGAGTPINGNRHRSDSRFFPSGGWHGNDTIWRVVDDLNRILFFYDVANQRMSDQQQRRYFAVVDGIVAMEGNGPLRGSPKPCGVILGGDDPLAIDVVAAALMGFDWQRIRMLDGIAASNHSPKYSDFRGQELTIKVTSNMGGWDSIAALKRNHLGFQPAAGWRGFVEQRCETSESTTGYLSSSKI